MAEAPRVDGRIDLDRPRWQQNTYIGRAKHFFSVTDPRNVLLTGSQLDKAKELLKLYREKKEPAGVTDDQVYAAKKMYESAFHPQTQQKMFLPGRMSFQVPGNMTITGLMMTYYRSTPAVLFWQWINQSFNAVVNYTNRSGKSDIPESLLLKSYIAATTCAVGVAVGLNKATVKLPPLVGRMVPFAAVCSANCVNIPMMRQSELIDGIDVLDDNGEVVGQSKAAARSAITQVVFSRILMATPGMALTPVIMNALETKTKLFKGRAWLGAPVQVGIIGLILTFATPLACAVFEQNSSIGVSKVEDNIQLKLREMNSKAKVLTFNKGL
ncbi:sideroflexin-1-like [Bolinopsis microptera]|uniref:sideroflexin-1-like n=1 Tax=Bolinopsis microptera TaxID=2820187 RepID=UPI00307ABEAE